VSPGRRGGFNRSVAVVTGGGSGIGFALARRLHEEGARVAVVDRSADAIEGAVDLLGGTIGLTADVTDEAAVQAMVAEVVARFGPIDIYCSNAGIATAPGLGDNEAWQEAWAVHSLAHIYAARAVLPSMVTRQSGHFVITASAAGLLMLMKSAPYTVTKHAAVALAEWMAVEYGGDGVHIHCLAPQGVRTPMVTSDPAGEAEVAASGRIIEPTAVADAVVAALGTGEFMVLPHPEVHDYETAKVADRTVWLRRMRSLRGRI
jgi:NAD(P)-dependent dehydrogenase (short-subunit alcohol dehydrogenase family)